MIELFCSTKTFLKLEIQQKSFITKLLLLDLTQKIIFLTTMLYCFTVFISDYFPVTQGSMRTKTQYFSLKGNNRKCNLFPHQKLHHTLWNSRDKGIWNYLLCKLFQSWNNIRYSVYKTKLSKKYIPKKEKDY